MEYMPPVPQVTSTPRHAQTPTDETRPQTQLHRGLEAWVIKLINVAPARPLGVTIKPLYITPAP